jgi:hypothetical protein
MRTESVNGITVGFVDAVGHALCSEQDALDLMGETYGSDATIIAVPVARFDPTFFDLSSRMAGHFIQKLQNYQLRLAVIGDLSAQMEKSTALRDFVSESNRIGHHLFVANASALAVALERR